MIRANGAFAVCLFALLSYSSPSWAIVIEVPEAHGTIQLGMDAAALEPEKIVSVRPLAFGNYGPISFDAGTHEGVRVEARAGFAAPVIDGGQSVAVQILTNPDPNTALVGIKLTNFTDGIHVVSTVAGRMATIQDCEITGGAIGVRLEGAEALVIGNTFAGITGLGVWIDYGIQTQTLFTFVQDNIMDNASLGGTAVEINQQSWSFVFQDTEVSGNTIDGWDKGVVINQTGSPGGSPPRTIIKRNIVVNSITAGFDCNNVVHDFCFEDNDAWANGPTDSDNYCECGGGAFPNPLTKNLSLDPWFCSEHETPVQKYTLRIDSPCSIGNYTAAEDPGNVQIGAKGVECAWGTIVRDAEVPANTQVEVLEDVIVPEGLILTLLPGATLKFDETDQSGGGSYSDKNELWVEGSLVGGALGQAPVVFTSATAPSDWGGITCFALATVQLTNATVEYAEIGIHYLAEDISNKLEDITFQNNGTDDVRANGSFYAGASRSPRGTFLNCMFNVNGVYGARMQFKTNNMTFEGCTFIGGPVPLAGMAWLYSGGMIDGGQVRDFSNGAGILTTKQFTSSPVTPTIRNVQVSGNNYGMEWRNDSGGLVENCTFTPGSGQPTDIWIRDTAAPTIRSNTFEENSGNTGIRVDDDAAPDLGPNNILQARRFGISTHWTSAPEIHDNQISDCYNGIFTEWTSAPRVRGNQIDNCRYGVRSASTASPDLGTFPDDGNNSITNSQTKLVDGGTGRVFPLMAENNWWGSDPPTPGKFTQNVDYTPWLFVDPFLPGAPGLLGLTKGADVPFISGVFPNPTRSGTRFVFQVPRAAQGELEIFDVSGRLVHLMPLGEVQEGALEVKWDGLDVLGNQVATGVYLYRLRVGAFEKRGRLTVIR